MRSLPQEGKGGSGMLLPWGGGEGSCLCREGEDRQTVLEERVVFKVEGRGVALSGTTQNGSSCQDHSAQVHLHKSLLTALVMRCLVSNIAVLCYLIPHLPPPGVSAPPPCPGAMPSFSGMCAAAATLQYNHTSRETARTELPIWEASFKPACSFFTYSL